nr:hypothetical protein Iba_chr15aCG0870 [Ipomoea batatas]
MIHRRGKIHFLKRNSSPDSLSKCLIHLLSPFLPPPLPPLPVAPTCAMSSPFPTGKKTERTILDFPSRTLRHRKSAATLELAFLHISTAPPWPSFATLSNLEKSFLRQSTTRKSIPTSPSMASSGSPTIISGDIPAFCMASAMHTCRPPAWRVATASPTLVAVTPPFDHASTISCAFHPAAMADINSATLDS